MRSASDVYTWPEAHEENAPMLSRLSYDLVWLLQRDLPVPPALLRETKGANATQVCTTPHGHLPVHPWSTYHNLVSTLCIAEEAQILKSL